MHLRNYITILEKKTGINPMAVVSAEIVRCQDEKKVKLHVLPCGSTDQIPQVGIIASVLLRMCLAGPLLHCKQSPVSNLRILKQKSLGDG